jgi:hypothetical protein
MIVVLCSASDAPALWAWGGLKQLGVRPLELVLAESLAQSSLWEHRVGRDGAHLKIVLPDRRVLCSTRIRGVLNRLVMPSQSVVNLASASDREYAQSELQAFYLSWLHGLPGTVLNRPTALGLCGSWLHRSEWMVRARDAGLRIPTYRQTSQDRPEDSFRSPVPDGARRQTLIAFDGAIFGGEQDRPLARACTRLAEKVRAEILGIDLYANAGGEWVFAGASACPDLSLGGQPLLERIAYQLEGANA